MSPPNFPKSLVSATLVATLVGWIASCWVLVRSAGSLSEAPGLGAWIHAGLASWLVPFGFASACALWLALCVTLEARFAEHGASFRRYAARLALLSVPELGLPGYALAWALTSNTTAWKPGVSEWQFALLALAAAPLARLALAVSSRGVARLARRRERLVAGGMVLLAGLGFGGWALLTAPLRERYGASQLLGFGLVTAGLQLVLFAWYERRGVRFERARAGLLLGLGALGLAALLTPPSRSARELFHLERPTRWFARALGAALPDSDRDGAPRDLGLLRGGDCDDGNAARSPFAFDVPGNGLDENCFAGDANPAIAALSPVAPDPAGSPGAASPRRNVLVIGLDSLRFDSSHASGIDPALMPELARVAAEGVTFADFRTCAPRTRESVADLLGTRPGHGASSAMRVLTARGVHTAFIASDWLARHADVSGFVERRTPEARYGAFADGEVLAALEKFLHAPSRQPFFVFSHFLGAHEPYEIGKACATDVSSPYARYRCALGELDRKLRALLSALRSSGLAERTVVAITADHGEEFHEHGGRYHATTLYDEVLHVPLVLHVPGRAPALVSTPVSCLDFLPTVLGAAGFPAGIAARGRDRLDAPGEAPAQFARTRSASERGIFEPKQSAVVYAGYKLIWDRATGIGVYFDLARDPRETRPLARVPAALETQLLALMDSWLSDQSAPRGEGPRVSLSRLP